MAQIIKHRRGSLESLSTVTGSLQKGEIVIASGSTNLTASNGNAIAFIVPADGTVQATNRIIRGTTAPNVFPASTYNGMLNGIPYYASSSTVLPTLYLLGGGANEAIDLVGNIQPFSQSVATSINALSSSIGSGTIGTSVTALNTFSASVLTQLSTVGTYTASLETKNSSLATITGSLISSSSIDATKFATLATYTSSLETKNSTLATYTGSLETKNSALATVTGSLISSASIDATKFGTLATYTASLDTKNTSLATITGSLISSASAAAIADANQNTFTASFNTAFGLSGANVTVKGNLTVSGTTTTIDSTTVQIGDNIIELNGTGAANGGLLVKDPTAPNTVSGSLLWDSTNDYWKAGAAGAELKLLRTGGDSVVSGSSQVTLQSTTGFSTYDTALATVTGSLISSASADRVAITNLNLYTSSNSSTTALNSFTASVNTQLNTLGTYTGSLETKNSALATVTGSLIASASSILNDTNNLELFSSSVLTQLSTLATYTGSLETKNTSLATLTGSLIASASANRSDTNNLELYTASLETKNSTLATYTASLDTKNTSLATVTGSLISSASIGQTRFTTLGTYTGSIDTKLSTLATYTGSLETKNTSLATVTGSLISSASSQNSRISVLEGTGTIQGVGTGNSVTFNSVSTTANLTVGGDLVVQGNTVTLNTATLVVEDKLISLASGSTNAATANGAGIEVLGASATITYQSTPDAWQFNKPITGSAVTASLNVPSGGCNSKRIAFRDTTDNINFVTAPTTAGDLLQYDGTNFVMSNTIDGGSF